MPPAPTSTLTLTQRSVQVNQNLGGNGLLGVHLQRQRVCQSDAA